MVLHVNKDHSLDQLTCTRFGEYYWITISNGVLKSSFGTSLGIRRYCKDNILRISSRMVKDITYGTHCGIRMSITSNKNYPVTLITQESRRNDKTTYICIYIKGNDGIKSGITVWNTRK